jgi:hypothetical protein
LVPLASWVNHLGTFRPCSYRRIAQLPFASNCRKALTKNPSDSTVTPMQAGRAEVTVSLRSPSILASLAKAQTDSSGSEPVRGLAGRPSCFFTELRTVELSS